MITAEGVELPEGNLAEVWNSYKYLGIPQANGNHEQAARRSATSKVENWITTQRVVLCRISFKLCQILVCFCCLFVFLTGYEQICSLLYAMAILLA